MVLNTKEIDGFNPVEATIPFYNLRHATSFSLGPQKVQQHLRTAGNYLRNWRNLFSIPYRRRSTGLSGRFLPGIRVLRTGLLSPVELQDGVDPDFPDAPLEVGILGRNFAAA